MGSCFGPNYACFFVGHIEEQIFQQYKGKTPDLYKRYIDEQWLKINILNFDTFYNSC